ncbi:MAG: hypothetical protein ACD_8C00029G0018 [uncultured bacterium]|nr:MAG: hypothetical protein ACD_8C00029G0018 [uncultured bacterium]
MRVLMFKNIFLFVIFCLPSYLIRVTFFGLPTNLLELFALAAIGVLLIKKGTIFLKKISSLPKLFLLATALLILGLLLSIFSNNSLWVGLGIFKGWFIVPILFSFAVYAQIESRHDIEKIFLSIYLSTAVVSLVSLGYKLIGLETFDHRLGAFYLSPNHLAMYLAPGAIFGIYFLIQSFLRESFSKKTFLHLALFSSFLFALYFTYSYGAWIALLLSLFFCLFFMGTTRKIFLWVSLCFVLILVMLFTFQKNTEKFSSLQNSSARSSFASRQIIWEVSGLLIKENFILGIGPGNFQAKYLSKQPLFEPYLEWAVPQPHNLFLAFWLQAGLFGFAGFVLLFFFIFQLLFQSFKNKKDIALAMPLFVFFLYTILHGLIDTPYWKNDLSFLFWICVSLVLSIFIKKLKHTL